MRIIEKYKVASWNKIYKMLLNLYGKICSSEFKPDFIVGVMRGGLIPARILSDLLENPNLTTIRTECYSSFNVKKEPMLTRPLLETVNEKTILIIDDIADTGRSLTLIVKHIMHQNASEIKTATLFYKPWSIIKPNYFEEETRQWVVFPWDIKETVRKAFETNYRMPISQLSEDLHDSGLPKLMSDRFLEEIAEVKIC